MIKEASLKIFLSNGITLTVKGKENVIINGEKNQSLHELYDLIATRIEDRDNVEFAVEIDHEYKDGDKTLNQKVKHNYFIPSEKITWYMIEEV